ncbi:ABC transporter ATP-binding protein [Adlercreutzia shanghongiae]|uniref:ABC transporter ATP-binding protein n=1 Tax=Adlercreutzia shanghongiae TaxID=3111773 RepID=A0ABU6IVW6_9ACTN|nr:ABC transporter ATP-binding protein [Adlercreutzia sp. R22]MEC4293970.1 ABC transporter ATP-binding protein [Adlercreutzia sp. R22]
MELKLDRLTKQFGAAIAVDRVSAAFSPGVYGLLGANGAGKTTLMRMICDVLKPTSGSVIWNGGPIERLGADYRALLGYLPQDFGYYPDFTALDFMLYLSSLKGIDGRMAKRRSMDLLDMVGLADVCKRKIRTYSGGMKQRLGIAQAVINDPKVLVLDEPTAGLDPKERVRFRNIISSFAQDKIVILSTHIVSDVEYIADEILMMRAGSIVMTGTVAQIVADIRGTVWECGVTPQEASAMAASMNVGNLHYDRGGMAVVRLVSDTRPHPRARLVEPTLEDVYLHLFSEQSGDASGERGAYHG